MPDKVTYLPEDPYARMYAQQAQQRVSYQPTQQPQKFPAPMGPTPPPAQPKPAQSQGFDLWGTLLNAFNSAGKYLNTNPTFNGNWFGLGGQGYQMNTTVPTAPPIDQRAVAQNYVNQAYAKQGKAAPSVYYQNPTTFPSYQQYMNYKAQADMRNAPWQTNYNNNLKYWSDLNEFYQLIGKPKDYAGAPVTPATPVDYGDGGGYGGYGGWGYGGGGGGGGYQSTPQWYNALTKWNWGS